MKTKEVNHLCFFVSIFMPVVGLTWLPPFSPKHTIRKFNKNIKIPL